MEVKSSTKTDEFEIERITPDIILVKGPSQKRLAELFVRFQEHYESPIPEIRGKVFTLGQLKSAYATQKKGAYTYVDNSLVEGDWAGFNFPNYVFEPFVRGLFDPLSKEENDFVGMFRHRTDMFYIIGVFESASLAHEISHALYYLSVDYRSQVDAVIMVWDQLEAMKKLLREWGYCEEVLLDEVQAYILADYTWLKTDKAEDLVKHGVVFSKASEDVRDKLRAIREELFHPEDEKYKEIDE